jgi:hypothetical protein
LAPCLQRSPAAAANGVQGVARPKGETAEERKARKAAVKEAQRQARSSKKALKQMFKSEATKQKKQAAGTSNTTVVPIP